MSDLASRLRGTRHDWRSDYEIMQQAADEIERLEARLAECERTFNDYWQGATNLTEYMQAMLRIFPIPARATSSASVCLHQIHNGDTCEICGAKVTPVVQPERCCLDYPRCDCNSPPEPDDDWHCSQYPGCECFAGCREKALEAAP
jgi:hypothetical protein